MKLRIKFLVLASVLIAASSYSQMNDLWRWLNPSPQGNTLNSVDFVDNNIGYAAGAYGTLLKSTNGGALWSQINSGTNKDIISMSFVNANTGYIGGSRQMLRKTTDGGNSWQNLTLPVNGNWDTAYYVMDINFVNSNTGYVAGFFQLESKIWKTTDAGNSWQTQSTGTANYIFKLYFIDSQTGFGYGGPTYSEVIKTTNGGANWLPASKESYIARSMFFINSTTGVYGCENGRVFRTTDGGDSWTFAYSPSSLDINSIQFTDANTGFGFGSGSVYIKTTNGGLNWEEFPIGAGATNRQYFDADITPNGTINVVGNYGAMVRTTNSGAVFTAQPYVTQHSISAIEFINVNTGYAVSGFGEGDILKTTDAGDTWVSQVSSYTLPIYGISFTGTETGYLAGSINVKKTINGGTNWVDVYTSTQNEIFTDVFFTNVNTGYVVGSYGKLLKTTNAGASWNSSVIQNPGTMLGSIFFTDENTGYAVGDFSAGVKTTNAGINWFLMNVPAGTANLNNIFFDNVNTGYVSASNGIYKTTDAGNSWFVLSTPASGYNNVQFRGNYGYAIGGSGKIIKSTDAGNNWIVQPTVTTNSLYALYFNEDDYIYAGGVLGTLIKTIPMELLLTPVSGNSYEIPETYFLQQNYPNPFNPATTIKFGITKQSPVSVKVYDVAGRLVTELLSGNMNPGTYEVKWNAVSSASGVYFYIIKTNEFSETRKMILVK